MQTSGVRFPDSGVSALPARSADVPPALSVKGLRKVYADGFIAVSDLDLQLDDGAFFGLLGPNGAGKTTLIGSVCNIVKPTAGELTIFGHDYRTREARRLIGLAEQEINVDRFLSVRQLLIYHAGYHGIGRKTAVRRADELLHLFRLEDKADGRAYELSGGMQRRLVIARALMHHPRLLILDEPTAGVDVELRAEIWGFVSRLNAAGTTILLTTHYLEEAESLCDEIAVIRAGRIIDRGSAASLRDRYEARDISEVYARVIAAEATPRAASRLRRSGRTTSRSAPNAHRSSGSPSGRYCGS
jgi:ABC-2 type transport system ATP-binding protein